MTITEGPDKTLTQGNRRTIKTGERIPNAAIFLKRTGLEFLQTLFSVREAGSFKYVSGDNTKSEITITDLHAVELDAVNSRPAIIAVRGPLSFQGVGGIGNVQERSIRTGSYVFTDMLLGSVTFICMSREGIEAENIAHLVFNSFKYFKPVLQKYGYFTIKSLSLGSEMLVEQEGADDKTTIVPVNVTAMIQDRWSLSDKAGRTLKNIIIETVFKAQSEPET